MPFVGTIGPPTLVVLAVISVLTGRLIPKSTHDAMIAQAARWEEAYKNEAARGDELARQVGELMELARSSEAILKALPRAREPL